MRPRTLAARHKVKMDFDTPKAIRQSLAHRQHHNSFWNFITTKQSDKAQHIGDTTTFSNSTRQAIWRNAQNIGDKTKYFPKMVKRYSRARLCRFQEWLCCALYRMSFEQNTRKSGNTATHCPAAFDCAPNLHNAKSSLSYFEYVVSHFEDDRRRITW